MRPKILSRKIKYRGFWAEIEEAKIRLSDGKVVRWETIVAPDAVVIVPIDKEKNIYLVKEWRATWEKEILQVPAGICKGKTKKEILKQASNELREEVGLDAKKWKKLMTFLLAGRQKTKLHVFLATDLFKSEKKPDEGEIIKVIKMPFKRACDDFLSGKIETTSYTIIGIALAKERLKL